MIETIEIIRASPLYKIDEQVDENSIDFTNIDTTKLNMTSRIVLSIHDIFKKKFDSDQEPILDDNDCDNIYIIALTAYIITDNSIDISKLNESFIKYVNRSLSTEGKIHLAIEYLTKIVSDKKLDTSSRQYYLIQPIIEIIKKIVIQYEELLLGKETLTDKTISMEEIYEEDQNNELWFDPPFVKDQPFVRDQSFTIDQPITPLKRILYKTESTDNGSGTRTPWYFKSHIQPRDDSSGTALHHDLSSQYKDTDRILNMLKNKALTSSDKFDLLKKIFNDDLFNWLKEEFSRHNKFSIDEGSDIDNQQPDPITDNFFNLPMSMKAAGGAYRKKLDISNIELSENIDKVLQGNEDQEAHGIEGKILQSNIEQVHDIESYNLQHLEEKITNIFDQKITEIFDRRLPPPNIEPFNTQHLEDKIVGRLEDIFNKKLDDLFANLSMIPEEIHSKTKKNDTTNTIIKLYRYFKLIEKKKKKEKR
jgi:hypothetical protein